MPELRPPGSTRSASPGVSCLSSRPPTWPCGSSTRSWRWLRRQRPAAAKRQERRPRSARVAAAPRLSASHEAGRRDRPQAAVGAHGRDLGCSPSAVLSRWAGRGEADGWWQAGRGERRIAAISPRKAHEGVVARRADSPLPGASIRPLPFPNGLLAAPHGERRRSGHDDRECGRRTRRDQCTRPSLQRPSLPRRLIECRAANGDATASSSVPISTVRQSASARSGRCSRRSPSRRRR